MKEFFKNTKPFGQLITLLVMVVLFFIIISGVLAVSMLNGADISNLHFQLVFQGVTQILTFLLPAILFAWLFSNNGTQFLKLDFHGEKWLMAFLGVLILVSLLPLSDWLTQVNDSWHWHGSWSNIEDKLRQQSEMSQQMIEGFLSLGGIGNLILNLIVIALIPAVSEEFLFRGVLQQWFGRWIKSPHLCIVLTAAVFSLAHGEIFAFLPRFVLGVVLGYLFYYSKSMLVNMTVHFFNNATIVGLYYMFNKGMLDENYAESLNAAWSVVIIGIVFAGFIFYNEFIKPNKAGKSQEQ